MTDAMEAYRIIQCIGDRFVVNIFRLFTRPLPAEQPSAVTYSKVDNPW
ncbi:MAG: hypothetical protein RBQ88_07935 [Desulfobulbus oligotrophicus]|nr:hypothetical protein [Desulfobulbus oligotrophicus]